MYTRKSLARKVARSNPIIFPIYESISDSITSPIADPIINPIIDPIINPIIDPIINPIIDPIIDSITDLISPDRLMYWLQLVPFEIIFRRNNDLHLYFESDLISFSKIL